MNLPSIVRTKAEALALAAEIIPTTADALYALRHARPVVTFPRYSLDFANADALRHVFEWLSAKQTRVYKRAQWHLFYTLANRFVREVDANGQAKVREVFCSPSASRTLDTYAFGDGDGI